MVETELESRLFEPPCPPMLCSSLCAAFSLHTLDVFRTGKIFAEKHCFTVHIVYLFNMILDIVSLKVTTSKAWESVLF